MTTRRSLAEVCHHMTKTFREELRGKPRRLDWTTQPSPYKDCRSGRKWVSLLLVVYNEDRTFQDRRWLESGRSMSDRTANTFRTGS